MRWLVLAFYLGGVVGFGVAVAAMLVEARRRPDLFNVIAVVLWPFVVVGIAIEVIERRWRNRS